jgi:hypothetical protein
MRAKRRRWRPHRLSVRKRARSGLSKERPLSPSGADTAYQRPPLTTSKRVALLPQLSAAG